jgi:hypothetical protein
MSTPTALLSPVEQVTETHFAPTCTVFSNVGGTNTAPTPINNTLTDSQKKRLTDSLAQSSKLSAVTASSLLPSNLVFSL